MSNNNNWSVSSKVVSRAEAMKVTSNTSALEGTNAAHDRHFSAVMLSFLLAIAAEAIGDYEGC